MSEMYNISILSNEGYLVILRGINDMNKKSLHLLYVSAERAEFCINVFIKLCLKKGILTKIKKAFFRNILYSKYNIIISDTCKIGNSIKFPHPQNIVIGSDVQIGDNCIIYQDVTIGQNRGKYPTIGNNVIIYPGAKIIGNIIIDDFVIVGANAVVISDVPNNAIVAGIPAKVIKMRSLNDEFY